MQTLLITKPQTNYELIDSGDGEKLERYGSVVIARPDPQALWPKARPAEWAKAQAVFSRDSADKKGEWKIKKGVPESWPIEYGSSTFLIKPSPFKHVGLFPEQLQNWQWLQETITKAVTVRKKPVSILNLFAYTGGSTLAAAAAGAEVCHVDGSKATVTWASKNAELSGLAEKPIRWIVDDAIAFMKRELKRGRHYDGIIMDPPSFGHGPKGEVWKIEENFTDLLALARELLTDEPVLLLINGYAAGYSSLAYENAISSVFKKVSGKSQCGELAIQESYEQRLLPCGIYARWRNTTL